MNCLSTRRFSQDSLRQRRHLWMFIPWLLLLVSSALHGQVTEPTEDAPEAPEAETVAPEPEPIVSREERYNHLLAAAAPEEVRWLGSPEDKVLALFRPTEARITKGIVLMLHAAEDHPVWPPSLENLRRHLPRHGWATLAVALPPQTPQAVPQREIPSPAADTEEVDEQIGATADSSESASESSTEVAATAEESAEPSPAPAEPPSRSTIIAHRVDAAATFLGEQGQQSVVVLVDNSSVLDSLTALPASIELAGLVLVNLHPQEPLTTAQLETLWSNPGLPVLDIFMETSDHQQAKIRQRHRAAAQRKKVENYYQVRLLPLLPVNLDNPRSFWLERTRGFMEQHLKNRETSAD